MQDTFFEEHTKEVTRRSFSEENKLLQVLLLFSIMINEVTSIEME